MTGPATPGQEGPTYAPPAHPEGWIAQWDGMSKKYYFVQLSTGVSQWDTPTAAAPTGPTPQATPQGTEHPYGTPGQEGQVITNQDGSQSFRYPDGRVEPLPADGDRSLSGDISKFALNQFMGGGKKQNHGNQSGGGLGALAGQFLGGGNKPSHGSGGGNSAGGAGLVGALIGGLAGAGKKTNQQSQPTSYSGSTPQSGQSHGGGFMDNIGGMFGHHQGSSQGNNFGYSQHNNQQGGYSGTAPPASYQPAGSSNASYSAPPSQNSAPQSPHAYQPPYGSHEPSYGSPNPQQPPYGSAPQHPGSSQPPYSPPYGGIQHQDSYGGGAPPPQHGGQPQYGGAPPPNYASHPGYAGAQPPQHSGNLPQPQHGHFQGMHNQEHSGGLYGNQGQPPPPPGQGGYGGGPPQYGGQQGGGRW